MDVEKQWEQFMNEDYDLHELHSYDLQLGNQSENKEIVVEIPTSTSLKISTKTKIIYLNSTFNLNELFWKLKIVNYDDEIDGIVKKQIKFNFLNKDEVVNFENNIKNESHVKIKILNQINNPTGRVTFKDVRKVDIGYCRNDIVNPKKQSKSAFYNCFVIIFRKKINNKYQEFHVKLFNSGKVEIPGIQNDTMLNNVIEILISYLQPHFDKKIEEIKEKRQLILVNSNFNCNYYLNREKLVQILKKKYKIKCGMDSCSYPGIQCKYKLDTGIEISFMIFRTGSVLIVGKCNDTELYEIYDFLKKIFHDEYTQIVESESLLEKEEKQKHNKSKKRNKKSISIYI